MISAAALSRSILRRSTVTLRRSLAEMPVPQSSKAKLFQGHPTNEGWESTVAWFYPLSFFLIVAILGFTPNTEITTWARQEAQARLKLKEAGFTDFKFGTHYQDLTVNQAQEALEKFNAKALRMNDDDDDDEEEEEDDE